MQFVFSEALYKKPQPQGGINNMKKIPCILITPVVKEQRNEDIFWGSEGVITSIMWGFVQMYAMYTKRSHELSTQYFSKVSV